jgi:DNA-directed RNA polymerase specialized sigma24 family protein
MHGSTGVKRRGLSAEERISAREQLGILRQRADLLGAEQAAFVEMVLDRGSSFGQIARLTGMNEGALRRRFQQLIGRLVSKETLVILRSRKLDTRQRTVARAYYIEGLSQEEIARRNGCTLYYVRKTVETVKRLSVNG